jgi:hypothetical protein
MDDLARQNSDCTLYGRRDAGNLSVCGRLVGVHRDTVVRLARVASLVWSLAVWAWPPRVPRAHVGTGSHQGVART